MTQAAEANPRPAFWAGLGLSLSLRTPAVCAIVNRTPDSFSDGGDCETLDAALRRAERCLAEGAAMIDLGGESTRPGARPVPADEELRRVLPLVEALSGRAALSVDTHKASVAERCLRAGAQWINDVSALGDPDMAGVVAAHGAGVVLMHMRGRPETMQVAPSYEDPVEEVRAALARAADQALAAGIRAEAIALDPGFGFGKTLEHNLALVRGLRRLSGLGFPLMIGISRKSMLGQLTGRPVSERLAAGTALHALCLIEGAQILRVHDVAAAVDAVAAIRPFLGIGRRPSQADASPQ